VFRYYRAFYCRQHDVPDVPNQPRKRHMECAMDTITKAKITRKDMVDSYEPNCFDDD
jgi:hypothetical protein